MLFRKTFDKKSEEFKKSVYEATSEPNRFNFEKRYNVATATIFDQLPVLFEAKPLGFDLVELEFAAIACKIYDERTLVLKSMDIMLSAYKAILAGEESLSIFFGYNKTTKEVDISVNPMDLERKFYDQTINLNALKDSIQLFCKAENLVVLGTFTHCDVIKSMLVDVGRIALANSFEKYNIEPNLPEHDGFHTKQGVPLAKASDLGR